MAMASSEMLPINTVPPPPPPPPRAPPRASSTQPPPPAPPRAAPSQSSPPSQPSSSSASVHESKLNALPKCLLKAATAVSSVKERTAGFITLPPTLARANLPQDFIDQEEFRNMKSNIEMRKVTRNDVDEILQPEFYGFNHRWLVLCLYNDFSHIFVPDFRDLVSLDRIHKVMAFSRQRQKTVKLQFFQNAPFDAFVTPASSRNIYFGPIGMDTPPPLLILLQSVDGQMMLRELYQSQHNIHITAEQRTTAFWILNINGQTHFEIDTFSDAVDAVLPSCPCPCPCPVPAVNNNDEDESDDDDCIIIENSPQQQQVGADGLPSADQQDSSIINLMSPQSGDVEVDEEEVEEEDDNDDDDDDDDDEDDDEDEEVCGGDSLTAAKRINFTIQTLNNNLVLHNVKNKSDAAALTAIPTLPTPPPPPPSTSATIEPILEPALALPHGGEQQTSSAFLPLSVVITNVAPAPQEAPYSSTIYISKVKGSNELCTIADGGLQMVRRDNKHHDHPTSMAAKGIATPEMMATLHEIITTTTTNSTTTSTTTTSTTFTSTTSTTATITEIAATSSGNTKKTIAGDRSIVPSAKRRRRSSIRYPAAVDADMANNILPKGNEVLAEMNAPEVKITISTENDASTPELATVVPSEKLLKSSMKAKENNSKVSNGDATTNLTADVTADEASFPLLSTNAKSSIVKKRKITAIDAAANTKRMRTIKSNNSCGESSVKKFIIKKPPPPPPPPLSKDAVAKPPPATGTTTTRPSLKRRLIALPTMVDPFISTALSSSSTCLPASMPFTTAAAREAISNINGVTISLLKSSCHTTASAAAAPVTSPASADCNLQMSLLREHKTIPATLRLVKPGFLSPTESQSQLQHQHQHHLQLQPQSLPQPQPQHQQQLQQQQHHHLKLQPQHPQIPHESQLESSWGTTCSVVKSIACPMAGTTTLTGLLPIKDKDKDNIKKNITNNAKGVKDVGASNATEECKISSSSSSPSSKMMMEMPVIPKSITISAGGVASRRILLNEAKPGGRLNSSSSPSESERQKLYKYVIVPNDSGRKTLDTASPDLAYGYFCANTVGYPKIMARRINNEYYVKMPQNDRILKLTGEDIASAYLSRHARDTSGKLNENRNDALVTWKFVCRKNIQALKHTTKGVNGMTHSNMIALRRTSLPCNNSTSMSNTVARKTYLNSVRTVKMSNDRESKITTASLSDTDKNETILIED